MASLEGAQAHQSKLYYEFSHLYDRLFTRVFYPRIERVIQALKIPPGARVLEVIRNNFDVQEKARRELPKGPPGR